MKGKFTLPYKSYNFHIESLLNEHSIEGNNGLVQHFKIYREDMPERSWNGYLHSFSDLRFDVIFPDHINIKGTLRLYRSVSEDKNYIFLDADFGSRYEQNFQGNLYEVSCGEEPSNDDTRDDNDEQDIINYTPSYSMEINDADIIPGGHKNLFPYLYLQQLHAPDKANDDHFISYTYVEKDGANLYKTLSDKKDKTWPDIDTIVSAFLTSGEYISGENSALLGHFSLYPGIYDILRGRSCNYRAIAELFEMAIPIIDTLTEEDSPRLTSDPDIIDKVWQNVFALNLINGYNVHMLDSLNKILIVNAIFEAFESTTEETWDAEKFQTCLNAQLLLPDELFPSTAAAVAPVSGLLFTGTIAPYAIGTLQMVQHRHCGYEPGEIAHIENVLKGEVKEIRNKKSQIQQETITSGKLGDTQQDHSLKEYSLQHEIDRTLAQYTTTHKYDGFAPYGAVNSGSLVVTNATEGANLSSPVPAPAETSKKVAKNIVDDTISRISEKVYHHRENSFRQEVVEEITHVLDNRQGSHHIRGIYRWLNKVYEMQLINHGKRFMLDLSIDKSAWITNDGAGNITPGKPLPAPAIDDIKPETYLSLGMQYQADGLPAPPVSSKIVTAMVYKDDNISPVNSIPVPEGYIPDEMYVIYSGDKGATLIAGVQSVPLATSDKKSISYPLSPADTVANNGNIDAAPANNAAPDHTYESNSVPILLVTDPTATSYQLSLSLHCICHDYTFNAWRVKVYDQLMKGYQRLWQQAAPSQKLINSEHNKTIAAQRIRSAVKNACFDVLLQKASTGSIARHPDGMDPAIFDPAYVQFLSQAFDWAEMVFSVDKRISQPDKDELYDIFARPDNDDYVAYEESENIRILLPVNPHYHFKILYYLSTGTIFYGQDRFTPVIAADKGTAMALQDLMEPEHHTKKKVIEKWNVSVPTSMQWLQEHDRLFIHNKTNTIL